MRVSPLGGNLCLLEETEPGKIMDLIRESKSWWKQWFHDIRAWKEEDVDNERFVCIRIFGIPCHSWN